MSASLPPPGVLAELARENRAPSMIAGLITTMVISTVALGLRFVTLQLTTRKWGWDDSTLIIGWVFSMANAICCCLVFRYAVGRHLVTITTSYDDPLHHLEQYFKVGYFATVLWGVSLFFIKLSLLLFYRQTFLFRLQKWQRIGYRLILGYLIITGVATFFATVFKCWPINYFWGVAYLYVGQRPPVDGKCPAFAAKAVVVSTLNLFSDILVLIIPMVGVSKLQISLQKRVWLAGVFILGALCIVISVIRIPYLSSASLTHDPTWTNSYPTLFTGLEPLGGVLCACLPRLVPLLRVQRSTITQYLGGGPQRCSSCVEDANITHPSPRSDTNAPNSSSGSPNLSDHSAIEIDKIPQGSIRVKREFSVEHASFTEDDAQQHTTHTYQYVADRS